MKTYSRGEIVNKHGKFIAYFSKSTGSNDLEKFKNSFIYNQNIKEYVVKVKNDVLSCFVEYNLDTHRENCGYFMKVFNSLGELIEDTFPGYSLYDDSQESVEEVLTDLNLL